MRKTIVAVATAAVLSVTAGCSATVGTANRSAPAGNAAKVQVVASTNV